MPRLNPHQFLRLRANEISPPSQASIDADNVRRIQTNIANNIIARYEGLTNSSHAIADHTLSEWVENAQKKLPEIERCIEEASNQHASYGEMADTVMRNSKSAYEKSRSAADATAEIEQKKEEKETLILHEVSSTINELMAIAGRDVVISVFQSMITSSPPPLESNTKQSKPSEIDRRITHACELYLQAEPRTKWSVENVVDCMKAAQTRINILKSQSKLGNPNVTSKVPRSSPDAMLRQYEDRLELTKNSAGSMIKASPAKQSRRTNLTVLSLPRSSRATQTDFILAEDSTSVLQKQRELEIATETIDRLQHFVYDLESRIANLSVLHEASDELCNKLKWRLLHNNNFGTQIDGQEVEDFYDQLLVLFDGLADRPLVKFKNYQTHFLVTIADTFYGTPYEPHSSDKLHIFLLWYTIPTEFHDGPQADIISQANQYNILWLSSRLPSIIRTVSLHAPSNKFFIFYLEYLIIFPPLHGIARANLLMIIANITIRSEDGRANDSLWWQLYDVILAKRMGDVSDWGFIENIAFHYFLASGPSSCETIFQMAENSPQNLEFVQELRSVVVCDFIGILALDSTDGFRRRFDQGRTITHNLTCGEAKLAIVRAFDGNDIVGKEYIWTREDSWVTLASQGVQVEISGSESAGWIAYVKGFGASKTWFKIFANSTNLIEYLDKYHASTMNDAHSAYLNRYKILSN
ncbi:hypothetical protein BTUL_0125g00050 [Botrytis tulipae]|uniref:Uncharacterized protein n=1 Tax=Botrytis tulipae TaxID=87230 RepID=A0A4Z1EJ12_9HELO|nr:hypothetical protein BTUL_0125g00050 [Botrytis tulipae]